MHRVRREANEQRRIIKALEEDGAIVINGSFTKIGISDLICGIKYPNKSGLTFVTLEVKTVANLHKILADTKTTLETQRLPGFRWDVTNLKDLHYANQLLYLNRVKDKGGKAYLISTVEDLYTLDILSKGSSNDRLH